jgi:hypothetical protein
MNIIYEICTHNLVARIVRLLVEQKRHTLDDLYERHRILFLMHTQPRHLAEAVRVIDH